MRNSEIFTAANLTFVSNLFTFVTLGVVSILSVVAYVKLGPLAAAGAAAIGIIYARLRLSTREKTISYILAR